MESRTLSASERIDLASQELEMARQNEELASSLDDPDRRKVYELYGRRHRNKAKLLLQSVCRTDIEL